MKMIVYAVEAAERPLLERYGKQFGWNLYRKSGLFHFVSFPIRIPVLCSFP